MPRVLKYALIVLCLAATGTLLAQAPNPTVEIMLNVPTARMGQTITADVYVRGAVNIAGTDIGMTVDPTCLRIMVRQTGTFLPTDAENGGFSAFSELHDHDTRLAAALLQRSSIANGDGVFFRVILEVTCESGIAPLNVSFAELTGIEDLQAENARFITYTLAANTINTINAQLTIEPAVSVFYGIAPIDNALLLNPRPAFSWVVVTGATGYVLQIDDDTDFNADLVFSQLVNATSYTLPTALPYGVYYWRVLAVGGTELADLYRRLRISSPPLPAPLLVAPASLTVTGDTTPTLSWQAVASAASYEIEIDNHPTLATVPEFSGQSSTPTITSDALLGGIYYWRVRTINIYGAAGAWSLIRRLTVDTVPPAVPVPLVPADKAMVVIKPVWRWRAVATATSYQLAISRDTVCEESESYTVKAALYPTYTAVTPLEQGDYYWCVRARDAVGNAGAWSLPRRLTVDMLLSPLSNAVLFSALPTTPVKLTWQAIPGVTSYTVQIDDEDTFTDARILTVASVTTVTLTNPDLAYGSYFWRVLPAGQTIFQPIARRFSLTPPATLLAAPVLTAPASLTRFNVTTPTIQWTAVNAAAGYQLQWSTVATFLTNATTLSLSGTSHTFNPLPAGNGLITYWRVRTVNTNGAPGVWSLVRTFVIDTVPPAVPVPLVPADKAIVVIKPVWRWSAVSTATSYQLAISRDNVCEESESYTVKAALSPTYVAVTPLDQGDYYWCVRARDAVGNAGAWSLPRRLTVDMLLSPLSNAVLLSALPTTPVKLTWQAIPGVTSYTVQIDDEDTFTDARILTVATVTTITLTSPDLAYGSYFWRVLPAGQTIPQPVARRFSLTPAATLLAAPVLTAPASLTRFNVTTPTVQWAAVNAAAGYQLQWSTAATFLANATTLSVSGISHTFNPLPAGNGLLTYWRVRTVNTNGAPGVWSLTRTFVIDTVPPAVPVLVAPLESARITTGARTIGFKWNIVSQAARYELQIATDASFTSLVTTQMVSTTAFTLPTSLALPNGTYYWHLRAIDLVGNNSAYSAGRRLVVNLP